MDEKEETINNINEEEPIKIINNSKEDNIETNNNAVLPDWDINPPFELLR